jgi:hypothetical protein
VKEVGINDLRKGDLIIVRWNDASEVRSSLHDSHEAPEIYVKDLGIFLGVSGTKRKHILIGKDVIETVNDWGAARIPLELVESITLVLEREQIIPSIREIQLLSRKVRIRKYERVGMA